MELGALVCVAGTPRCGACPVREPLRLGAGRLPGPRRSAAAGAEVRRHRPAGARPAARRAPGRPRTRWRPPNWTPSGTTPSSGPAAWTPCWSTAWSSRPPTAASRSPPDRRDRCTLARVTAAHERQRLCMISSTSCVGVRRREGVRSRKVISQPANAATSARTISAVPEPGRLAAPARPRSTPSIAPTISSAAVHRRPHRVVTQGHVIQRPPPCRADSRPTIGRGGREPLRDDEGAASRWETAPCRVPTRITRPWRPGLPRRTRPRRPRARPAGCRGGRSAWPRRGR